MYAPLRRVLVRSPGKTFAAADPAEWHYGRAPDIEVASTEHRGLVDLLRESSVEVVDVATHPTRSADAIFVHDPGFVLDEGVVLLRMGKPRRQCEVQEHAKIHAALGTPLIGRLEGEARAEGGDLLWLTPSHLAVGQGFRTNREGLRQISGLLSPLGIDVVPVQLPTPEDTQACLHLMTLISMVDRDLAVAHPALLPTEFRAQLGRLGIATVEVPDGERVTMGPNVLAVAPRDCILLEGNPRTSRALAAAGCRVRTYAGREVSLNTEGGPTCLTRALARD